MTIGRKLRATEQTNLVVNNRKVFVIRKEGLGAREVYEMIVAVLAVIVGVQFLVDNDLRLGAALCVVVGLAMGGLSQQIEKYRKMLQAVEFMNALFSSALGAGYAFCAIATQDGKIVYLDRSFQALFPDMTGAATRSLTALLESYGAAAWSGTLIGELPRMPNQGRRGFTLLELSIVLVIIGLVAGAVMVGRDMIRGSEIRKVYSQYQQFMTAASTFKTKYNCLPGDCPNATDFFPAYDPAGGTCPPVDSPAGTATCNGDGDGYIDNSGSAAAYYPYEGVLFWQHLADAGLIGGTYSGAHVTTPVNALEFQAEVNCPPVLSGADCWVLDDVGYTMVYPAGYSNYVEPPPFTILEAYPMALAQSAAAENVSLFTPQEMQAFDAKYDDGLPITGTIMTDDNCGRKPGGINGQMCDVTDPGSCEYLVTRNNSKYPYSCTPIFHVTF